MASHEQGEMLLHLYELRREAKLRDARTWFIGNFHATTAEEVLAKYPPPSEGGTFIRMVTTYWDMVANFANRGLVDEEMLFETSGEQWLVWEAIAPIVPEWRALYKNPHYLGNLEKHAKRYEAWREKRAPGANDASRQMMARMRASRKASGAN
jgi:hypothetical protein